MKSLRWWQLFIVASLFFVLSAWGQRGVLHVQQQLENVNKNTAGRIYFVLNQPSYSPGDTAYISIWLLDERQQVRPGDRVVQMNVYRGDGELVQFQKVKLKNGRAATQLVVSESILPGRYKIAAFTPSMIAEKPHIYGSQWLEIEVNKKVAPRAWFEDLPARSYAEGHTLIQGLATKIFFTGIAGEEALLWQGEDLVEKIVLPESGVTFRALQPVLGKRYVAEFPHTKARIALPEVQVDGIAIEAETEQIHLSVNSASRFIGKPLTCVAVSQGQIVDSKPITFENERLRVTLPLSRMNTGLTELYVIDGEGTLIAHRKVVHQQFQTHIRVDSIPLVSQRDSVRVRLGIESNTFASQAGNFSIWVVQEKLFNSKRIVAGFPQTPFHAVNQFWAETSTSGTLEVNHVIAAFADPFYGVKKIQTQRKTGDDLAIRGKVFSTITNNLVADSTLVLAFLQNNAMGYEAYTKGGRFEIPSLLDFWGSESVFVTLKNKRQNLDATHRIEIETDTLVFTERWPTTVTAAPSVFGEYALFSKLAANSYRFYTDQSGFQKSVRNPNQLLEEEFLEPDHTVDVEKYVVFPTMQDLIKEAVPFVQVRMRKQERQVRLAYRTNNSTRLYGGNPLLVIDGRLTFDVQYFLSLLPMDVSYIKVLNNPNKLAQLGKLGENGVLFIQTKTLGTKRTLPESHYVNLVGLTRPKRLAGPLVPIDVRNPDFRATLFWNGNVRLTQANPHAELRFTASDDVGRMILIVAGFTDDGQWVHQLRTFEVNRKLR